jgi:DNA-binding MarR family transcriptional regulator
MSTNDRTAVKRRDAEDVSILLRESIGLLMRRLKGRPMEGEITMPESAALRRLQLEPTTASALARLEGISPQSMGATVAGLESRGLVERMADPADGRRSVLSLTAAGTAAMRSRSDARVALMADAIQGAFDAHEVEQLRAVAPLIERLARSYD